MHPNDKNILTFNCSLRHIYLVILVIWPVSTDCSSIYIVLYTYLDILSSPPFDPITIFIPWDILGLDHRTVLSPSLPNASMDSPFTPSMTSILSTSNAFRRLGSPGDPRRL